MSRTILALCLAAILSLSLLGCSPPGSHSTGPDPTAPAASSPASWTVSDWTVDLGEELTPNRIQLPQLDPLEVSGDLRGVGSSTLFPLTQIMYDRFVETGYRGVIELNSGGTSQGFELFCQGGADFVNASRPIRIEELALCRENDLQPVGFAVGLDALAIVVNPANAFVEDLRLGELREIFSLERWADVNAQWPNELIYRYMPDPGSGTLEFFLDRVFEEEVPLTFPNTEFSTDDTVIVEGISTNPLAVGFVGHAYYQQNQDLLDLVTLDNTPLDLDAVITDRYPLTRPLFIYTDVALMQRKPQLYAFLNFYLSTVEREIEQVGYFPSKEVLERSKLRFLEKLNLEIPSTPARSAAINQRVGPGSFEALQTQREQIEATVRSLTQQIAQEPVQPDAMFNTLRDYVQSSPSVFGAHFCFNPQIRSFCPYIFRSAQTLSLRDLAVQLDYATAAPWYVDPVNLRRPLWTEPYFATSGAGRSLLLTTYAVPVYNSRQELIGVLSSDLFLDAVEESGLESRKFRVVTAATRAAEQIRGLGSLAPDHLHSTLRDYLNAYPYLFGATFAISPQIEKTAPYLYRTSAGLQQADLAQGSEYDYALQTWYTDALVEDRPVWSDSYFRPGWRSQGKELLMVSLSLPVYRPHTEQLLGVLITDLLLEAYE